MTLFNVMAWTMAAVTLTGLALIVTLLGLALFGGSRLGETGR